ncbi:MAG: hypothetical protein FWG63_11515 [Defluviitaleaceae bacterium]|nr:hypothetical protein [Defluviitaleaceae bacterium]
MQELLAYEWFIVLLCIIFAGYGAMICAVFMTCREIRKKNGELKKKNSKLKEKMAENKAVMLSMADSWEHLAQENKRSFSEEAKNHTIEAIFEYFSDIDNNQNNAKTTETGGV